MLPWYSTEGAGERPDDEGSTGEGVGDKHTRGRGCKTRHVKNFVYTSNSFVPIRDGQQNVVQAKCCIIDCKVYGMTVEIIQKSQIVGIICRNITRPSS